MNYSFEPLDVEKIKAEMVLPNQPYLALEIMDVIDSTNTYLLRRAKEGAPSGTLCLAESQTAGRGRLGRPWFSPRSGNIYASLLWRFPEAHDLSGLSVAVGVIIVRALKKYGIPFSLQLKWPNDVLCRDRKLAGILLERYRDAVVIGIGLNLYLPNTCDETWISMSEIGQSIARNKLAGLLINELLTGISIYQKDGLKSFLADWRLSDSLFGKKIILQASKKISGIMQGIDESGRLLLKDENENIKHFCYGEASLQLKTHSSGKMPKECD